MKLLKAVEAHKAVCETMGQETSFAFAHALCMAKERLTPHVQFFAEKELALIQKYAQPGDDGNVMDQNGAFKVKPEEAENFFKEKAELDAVEVDVERVRVSTTPERITGRALELLLEVMDFQDEREGEET